MNIMRVIDHIMQQIKGCVQEDNTQCGGLH